MAKSRLKDPTERPLAQRMLAGVLDVILRLLHPIMPYLTEAIWQALPGKETSGQDFLMFAEFPTAAIAPITKQAPKSARWIISRRP